MLMEGIGNKSHKRMWADQMVLVAL
jgi:hypothetical protein